MVSPRPLISISSKALGANVAEDTHLCRDDVAFAEDHDWKMRKSRNHDLAPLQVKNRYDDATP